MDDEDVVAADLVTGAIRAPATGSAGVDLRRAPLGDLRSVDLRATSRDVWDDERALWDRLLATWAGLDDAAWHLPGAAPSDAGGPDWSLAEHVGHLADWQELAIDYVVLARYMRVLPAASCWRYAGGRIINLHHGLLPSFPGIRPYHDAYASRMLAFGATCHFIVPELDAGNQIINQSTYSV